MRPSFKGWTDGRQRRPSLVDPQGAASSLTGTHPVLAVLEPLGQERHEHRKETVGGGEVEVEAEEQGVLDSLQVSFSH